jgi:hypothetical protein
VDERIASEWNGQSDAVINEKIGRRDEKPLAQVLRPAAARADISRGEVRPHSDAGARDRYTPPRTSASSSTPLSLRAVAPVEKSTAPESAPVSVSAPTPTPTATSAPKQFVRLKVDIEELRRSINESLKKQAEGEVPQEEPKV